MAKKKEQLKVGSGAWLGARNPLQRVMLVIGLFLFISIASALTFQTFADSGNVLVSAEKINDDCILYNYNCEGELVNSAVLEDGQKKPTKAILLAGGKFFENAPTKGSGSDNNEFRTCVTARPQRVAQDALLEANTVNNFQLFFNANTTNEVCTDWEASLPTLSAKGGVFSFRAVDNDVLVFSIRYETRSEVTSFGSVVVDAERFGETCDNIGLSCQGSLIVEEDNNNKHGRSAWRLDAGYSVANVPNKGGGEVTEWRTCVGARAELDSIKGGNGVALELQQYQVTQEIVFTENPDIACTEWHDIPQKGGDLSGVVTLKNLDQNNKLHVYYLVHQTRS